MKIYHYFLILTTIFVGCQKAETDYNEISVKKMKTVHLLADMHHDKTRAELSTYTGNFAWQTNDQISVLANDGKFYTLTLSEGAGSTSATFTGQIPNGASMTSVAMYPAIVTNGTDNTIFDETTGTLNYTLPSEYTFIGRNTNVPMVAAIEDGSTTLSFKQIGGVIRFPINALPAKAKIVFTAKNLTTTGVFPITLSELGTAAIEASVNENTNSTVTVNYTSEKAGVSADINIPVPTGTYEDFSIEVFDANDESLVAKEYSLNKDIERATLLIMNAIDAGPMTISDVWPYFVDARVLFSKVSGAQGYAFYIDDNSKPIIRNGEFVDGYMQAVIGGDFEHGSTHTVAIAKVVNGVIDESSKSETVEFTTGRVMQMTQNTGTKFICAGWDDVAIGVENSTQYVNGRWTPKGQAYSGIRNDRGYRVQLYAEDKTTLLYDEVPFSGQCDYGGAISSSSWIGRTDGSNHLLPSALTFGWLEPGKKYYFRVKTLDEPVIFDSPENGNFEPSTGGYTIKSTRGGSAWSNLVEMTTDSNHVPGDLEIFHEGFDDMMFNSDIMNLCSAAVPEVLTSATKKSDYENRKSATKYVTWLGKDFADRKFSEQGFNTMLHAYEHGLSDDNYVNNVASVLNNYAGSLEGWSVISADKNRRLYPNFGAVRLGQSGTGNAEVELRMPALDLDDLSADNATKCIITVQVSSIATSTTNVTSCIGINQYRDSETGLLKIASDLIDFSRDSEDNIKTEWSENYYGTTADADATDYVHHPVYFEVKSSLYLKNGDIISFTSHGDGFRGMLILGDIKIEIDPSDDGSGVERVWGTAPDGTNYDVWGMGGVMPITFWMGPPTLDQFNADAISESDLANIKTTYFDPIVAGGYNLIEVCNPYPASMKVILDWCQAAGIRMIDKSIGSWDGTENLANAHMDRIAQYANHQAFAGAFVGKDEPGYKEFVTMKATNDAFASRFPTKGRVINLFPSYANAHQLNCGNAIAAGDCDGNHPLSTSGGIFANYTYQYTQSMDINSMMFDHYCLKKSDKNGSASRGNVKSKQYYDLDIFRQNSLAKRIPYLMITHGRPAYDKGYSATIANTDPAWTTDVSATAIPEKSDSEVYDEQRWLVWSQLALGSKGVSYFCYWTPGGFKGGPFSFHYDGTKTRMYDILTNINKEIQPIGQILMKCHADGAIMTNPTGNFVLYQNDGMGLPSYGPVLGLERGNEEDVVAGCFRDATTGEYKVLVTHKAPATNDTEATTASIAKLSIDRNMATTVKLHTVTLSNGHNSAASTVVSEVNISNGTLTLTIPDGTAVLVEFPETAGKQYN